MGEVERKLQTINKRLGVLETEIAKLSGRLESTEKTNRKQFHLLRSNRV